MKKTSSLIGLLFAGVALPANPQTGIFATQSADDAMSGAAITRVSYTASVVATLDIAGLTG